MTIQRRSPAPSGGGRASELVDVGLLDKSEDKRTPPQNQLLDEFAALAVVDRAAWTAASIPLQAVIDCGGLRACRAHFGSDWWEFDENGHEAWCVPAHDDAGQLVDIIAWRPDRPQRFARLCGRAWCLGRWHDWWSPTSPLPVWRTPLRWLQREAKGVVVFGRPEAQFYLADRPLIAEDVEHGRMIRRAMSPPRSRVKVLVREILA